MTRYARYIITLIVYASFSVWVFSQDAPNALADPNATQWIPENAAAIGVVDAEALMAIEGAPGFLQYVGYSSATQSHLDWPSLKQFAFAGLLDGKKDNNRVLAVVTGKAPLTALHHRLANEIGLTATTIDERPVLTDGGRMNAEFQRGDTVMLGASVLDDLALLNATKAQGSSVETREGFLEERAAMSPCYVSMHFQPAKLDRTDVKNNEPRALFWMQVLTSYKLTPGEETEWMMQNIRRVFDAPRATLAVGVPADNPHELRLAATIELASAADAEQIAQAIEKYKAIPKEWGEVTFEITLTELIYKVDGNVVTMSCSGERNVLETNLIRFTTMIVPALIEDMRRKSRA